MDNNYEVGNFLYQMRAERGLTQKELAAMLGVTDKAVSKWETGAAAPRRAVLRQLAEILGCTQEELLEGRRIEEPEARHALASVPVLQRAPSDSQWEQQDEDLRVRLMEGIYALSGSRQMLIVVLCRLVSLILTPISTMIALKTLPTADGGSAATRNTGLFLLLLILFVSLLYLAGFLRCYRGGKEKDAAKLSGGLVIIRAFVISSLVINCLSLLSDLFGGIVFLGIVRGLFDVVFYAFAQKALLVLIRSVRERSWHESISRAVPVLLFLRVGLQILSVCLPTNDALTFLPTSASVPLSVLSTGILLLSAVCITLLLTGHRKLCETLRSENYRNHFGGSAAS